MGYVWGRWEAHGWYDDNPGTIHDIVMMQH